LFYRLFPEGEGKTLFSPEPIKDELQATPLSREYPRFGIAGKASNVQKQREYRNTGSALKKGRNPIEEAM